MIEVKAVLKHARISPKKARLVANQIRNVSVDKAANILEFSKKKAAFLIKKLLMSAISNAEHNQGLDIDQLYISAIFVDEGPVMKRFDARAKGRSNRIMKYTSHMTIKVAEKNKS